jgi:hypothetical protein
MRPYNAWLQRPIGGWTLSQRSGRPLTPLLHPTQPDLSHVSNGPAGRLADAIGAELPAERARFRPSAVVPSVQSIRRTLVPIRPAVTRV